MLEARNSQIVRIIPLLIVIIFTGPSTQAQYSGGTGEPNDPYQITTAEDLILLGESPKDYDKHFILTADIDLVGHMFDRALISSGTIDRDWNFHGTRFTGQFDGGGHVIRNLHIQGNECLGLFGQLGSTAKITSLGLEAVDVNGTYCVGGLVGWNEGTISTSYSTGTVSSQLSLPSEAGGLVGYNKGSITKSCSICTVTGAFEIGGLVGSNLGIITSSYSTGTVSGAGAVGGLVGEDGGIITSSYSTGAVSGSLAIGGLVGEHGGSIDSSYSTGKVEGISDVDIEVGGLVGYSGGRIRRSCWDVESSGQSSSGGGAGLTTSEMKDAQWMGLQGLSDDPNWVLNSGKDYPRLFWERTEGTVIPEPTLDWITGSGTVEHPYQIETADQLAVISKASIFWEKHLMLKQDIDLIGRTWPMALLNSFSGLFDGNGHVIRSLKIEGKGDLGLFGVLGEESVIRNLGLLDVDIIGTIGSMGGLAGSNAGVIADSYSTGKVGGIDITWPDFRISDVGGLVGDNEGIITRSHSMCIVNNSSGTAGGLVGDNSGDIISSYSIGDVDNGNWYTGGLVGDNSGDIVCSYSTGDINSISDLPTGGLVGYNEGIIMSSYSTAEVKGNECVGGLVGQIYFGSIASSYSAGKVGGTSAVGGLVGDNWNGNITSSFWDIETSGQTISAGGEGKTTVEMQDPNTFLDAGWDWLGEIENGTCELWQMPIGGGYPVQSIFSGYTPPQLQGQGTDENPYLVSDGLELGAVVYYDLGAHYRLVDAIDLSGICWGTAVIPSFVGTFDGNGLTISNLKIQGGGHLGLFGCLVGGRVKHLGLIDVNITGSGNLVGGLIGNNINGSISNSFSKGTVNGNDSIGGLVGGNSGCITASYSTNAVNGNCYVGGLVGTNFKGTITTSYSNCPDSEKISGNDGVGGLVGLNIRGNITMSYNTGHVNGIDVVGGLVGYNWEDATVSASFWDFETSGQATSAGGTGKTTSEMQTEDTFLEAGWDFADETESGTEDIWWILEGKGYPRLWWEAAEP